MQKGKDIKAITRRAKKGFKGYPLATVALYGPTDKKATKLVVGIVHEESAEPEEMKKWYSDDAVMDDPDILEEVHEFIKEHGARSVAMVDRIIGCPHEEGIDYPEGQACPMCPFWAGRDRWTGKLGH